MPEAVIRRKLKVDGTTSKIKETLNVKNTTTTTQSLVPVTKNLVSNTSRKYSVISETKIKKFLDEERINKKTIQTIKVIKDTIENKGEVKNELNELELTIVSDFINKYRKKLEKEEVNGKHTSTNEVSLRAFLDQKFKFKKDLSTYLAVICDLIVKEIMTASILHVSKINKKLINTNHVLRSELSSKLFYPLYHNLPSFNKQTSLNDTNTEETISESVDIEENKVNKWFVGNIKTLFTKLREGEHKHLKIQKKYQEFLSTLIVEFLDRLVVPLQLVITNNHRNRVFIKNIADTVVGTIIVDYYSGLEKYTEINTIISEITSSVSV